MFYRKIKLLFLITLLLSGCATSKSDEGVTHYDKELINAGIDERLKTIKQDGNLERLFDTQKQDFPNAANLPNSGDAHKVWTPPRLKKAESAVYPEYLARTKQEGLVYVIILIGEDGAVIDAKIQKSTNQNFNEAAILTVRKWQFTPALLDNIPYKAVLVAPVSFKLKVNLTPHSSGTPGLALKK